MAITYVARLRRPSRRAALVLLAGLVGAGSAACFKKWGQDLGGGAVDAVRDRSGELLGPLRDSVVALAGRMYDDSLRPRLDSTLTALLDTLEGRVVALEDTTAAKVEGRLNEALQELVAENLTLLRDSVQRSLSVWANQLSHSVRAQVLPVVADAADSAMSRAVNALDAGLAGPLRTTLLSLVVEISDSVRVAARRTVEEPAVKSFLQRLGLAGGLIAGAILAAAIAALVIISLSLRNSRRALEVVTAAIQDRGTPELKEAVQERATARKVEGWLHSYLEKKNLL
jgi:hypothetical protein